ncbi:hypothetical protein FLX56_18995 [Synechococcus moorigangaii CMS01]|nr:hypothetical protein [Synechococcus moorigangaii CMS01]
MKALSRPLFSCLPLLLGFCLEGAIAQPSFSLPTPAPNGQALLLSQVPVGRQVATQKATYAPSEPILVNYANLPGNAGDWITVVPTSAPDDSYEQWFYTDGQRSGSYQFEGLAPGSYEVRVYHNWPDGGYVVQDRYRFTVGTQTETLVSRHISTNKTVYQANESILVSYANLPGNAGDWITIVPANAPDDSYNEWFYTDGQRSGSRQFNGLTPGNYEVRVYYNWPDGGYVVQDRYAFTVR